MTAVEFTPEEELIVSEFCLGRGLDPDGFVRMAVMERMEDALDAEALREALEENREHPETCTFDEMVRRLGIE